MITRSSLLRLVAALSVVLAPLIVGLALVRSKERAARETPTLEPILELARSRRFDEAKKLLVKFLQVEPSNARGNLLLAQLATEGEQPDPGLALEHLGRIHETEPSKRALIAFFQGKARYLAKRYDLAEAAWKEALRLDPAVPEAGSALFNLYELEGRLADAYRLGLQLHEVEPDPRDRVRFLLLVARLDLNKPSPESQAKLFAPLVAMVPDHLPLSTTLGLALIRDSRLDEGIEVLRRSLDRHPDSPEAWDAYLSGLDEAGHPEDLDTQLQRLPATLRDDPRFAKHRGQVAYFHHDWKEAVEAFRVAHEFDRHDPVVLYRFSRALRSAGASEESERVAALLARYQGASNQLKDAVDQALDVKTLGFKPEPQRYQALADLRESMGRPDEARAWHRLVLRDDPGQQVSLAALERLK